MNSRLCFCFFELVCVVGGERKLFEKSFPFPIPLSFKNFPEDKVLAHTHSSPKAIGYLVHLAKSDSRKVLVKLFQKLAGFGAEPPKNSVFFLRSFFFCAYATKRKSERMTVDVAINQHIMFTLCFLTPHPSRSAPPSPAGEGLERC